MVVVKRWSRTGANKNKAGSSATAVQPTIHVLDIVIEARYQYTNRLLVNVRLSVVPSFYDTRGVLTEMNAGKTLSLPSENRHRPDTEQRKERLKALVGGARSLLSHSSGTGSAARVAEPEAITTASSQKRRKLAPFGSIDNSAASASDLYDTQSLSAHARSSPSSSSPFHSLSDAPSPASSETTRHTSPPRYIPPHLHEEVLSGRDGGASSPQQQGGTEGNSPSNALAEITIDSASSADMSGSENGAANTEQPQVVSPGQVLGGRSASPAKRSAADMEGSSGSGSGAIPGSFASQQHDGPTDFDEAMEGITSTDGAVETQQTGMTSQETSAAASDSSKSSATSFGSDAPPPYAAEDASLKISADGSYTTLEIDQQEAAVRQKQQRQLEEGRKGVVVSSNWLARVLSRSTVGLKSGDYPKEAREGPIGPVDNSDIVADDAFTEPILHDASGRPFIPLKPGLSMSQEYEIFNDDAWGEVVSHYGIKSGQKQIERYVRNTLGEGAEQQNLMYETYPPVFTIRKVPQPKSDEEDERPKSSSGSLLGMHEQSERHARGQTSPDDAVKIVSSRQEKFQRFLTRSKAAAGIPRSSKVRIFKMVDPSAVTMDTQADGAATAATPGYSSAPSQKKLVVTVDEFNKMEIGKDLDVVDARDETNNPSYNGSSNMELYILTESATLLLEEQLGGPGGGEYNSDKKKLSQKFIVGGSKKGTASQPASTTPSGRTSPAPGTGIMTRGRTRRDGRTKGTVGLNNLGNTCYMNSALQCIRSCEELAVYFLSKNYQQDINADNPLGHGGVMAKQYANLLSNIYADNAGSTVNPGQFKRTLGNFAPMFSGYGQQDSQEFLSFLVDALHEDLNRILKKPYNENPDSTDETVKDPQKIIELGETYRTNHHARNDSVAMDLFNGFYKNTMECPKCDKISITFDPFSLLTVQLPNEGNFQHTVTFVPLRDPPINHAIDCDKNWSIKMLKEYIASKHDGVDPNKLWMIEIYSHKIYKIFDNAATLGESSIQSNDHLFIFELDAVPKNAPTPEKKSSGWSLYGSYNIHKSEDKIPSMDDPKADCFAIPVFSRQKARNGQSWDVIFHPMYITVNREEAQDYDVVLKKALIAASRLTSRPILTEMSEDVGSGSEVNDEMQVDPKLTAGNGTGEQAQVNDNSGSEDGYVSVSLGADGEEKLNSTAANGTATNGSMQDERKVPPRFLDDDYFISPALRSQLFTLNYASGVDGTASSGFNAVNAKDVFDRVKKPSRRNSTQSASSEDSSTSTGSGTAANEDEEETDGETMDDTPDIVIGNHEQSEDESLPDNPLHSQPQSRKGRRKNKGKKGKRRQKTYSKKDRRGLLNGKWRPAGSSQQQDDEENPYYIKLGEALVLDWYPEAIDSLFDGDTKDPDELRGHFVSHADGKNLPLFHDPEIQAKRSRRELRRKHGITLDECFAETGKREVLSEDNAWYCNRCKELRRATKTLEMWTLPDILVVHLKRFGGNRSFRDKIDTLVDYPIEGLNMEDRVGLKEDGKEYVYDLFAVDNHYGGLGGGHYTAYAKNFFDGGWYDYNDTSCTRINEDRAQSSAAAYLLFYRRRSATPLGPQYLQDLVTAFRNPPPEAAAADDTAEESDAGEGRLGGPNGFLRGPSSASTGAGVGGSRLGATGVMGAAKSGGVGAAPAAGGALTTTGPRARSDSSVVDDIETKPFFGPERPPAHGAAATTWGFEGLDDADEADAEGTRGLVRGVETDADSVVGGNVAEEHILYDVSDDDAASTTAQHDMNDGGFVDSDRDVEDIFDSAHSEPFADSAGRTTPIELAAEPVWNRFQSSGGKIFGAAAQDASLDALHLEDAGGMGGEEVEMDDALPELISGPPTPARGHDKMD